MKQLTYTLIIIFNGLVIDSLNAQELFPDIKEEYQIDFTKSTYFNSNEETKEKVKSFFFRVRRKNDTDQKLKLSQLPIKVESFRKLYNIAKKKSDDTRGDKRGLTGFIMHYGLDENYKMELFFQPWCYKYINDDEKNKIIAGSVNIAEKPIFYIYQNEQFVPVDQEVYEKSAKNYWERISIRKKRSSRTFRGFEKRTDYRSDGQCAYFTFQEIKELDEYAPTVNPFYKGYVYSFEVLRYKNYAVHSRAGRTSGTIFAGKRNKITSMFTTAGVYNELIDEFQLPDNSKEKGTLFVMTEYGNLSGICPPGCDYFEFFYQ